MYNNNIFATGGGSRIYLCSFNTNLIFSNVVHELKKTKKFEHFVFLRQEMVTKSSEVSTKINSKKNSLLTIATPLP